MGVGQLIRNVITTETDPTVASFTKTLTSNNTILTAINAASGTISASVLPSYVDDVLNFANLAAFPVAGDAGKIYVTEDTNKVYRWSGSVYVEISSSATAGEALKLTNARTISTTGDATYSISFDGSANVSSAITLANTGVTAGTYNASATQVRPFTVNAKGLITGTGAAVDITPPWSAITGKPTTLDGFGIIGGTVTGDLVSTSATASTSTTTGAITAASLGITGAIFANTVSANSYNLIPVWRGAGGVSANTAVGVDSLKVNTTGNSCSAFGVDSLKVNTTGNSCSAFGVNSLRTNTTGNGCSAFGVNSLRANTTGNSCSAFGASAGRFQSDGVTEISVTNNSCFIGTLTKGTQNATNENVFGYNATGNGSNTVTIGDSNITNTYLKGVVSTDSTAASTSTTTGAIRAASLGITGAIFADTANAVSKITVGQNFSISSIGGYSNISLGNSANSEYGASSIEIPTNTLYGGTNSHHTGAKLVCGEMVGWGTAKFKIHTCNDWRTYNPIACFSVGDAGGTFLGSVKATSFVVGTNQVVSSRKSGWTAPTGTATRTTFATSTVTLSQLAETVKALIDDLTTHHGLIGA